MNNTSAAQQKTTFKKNDFNGLSREHLAHVCDVIDISTMKEWCTIYKPAKHEHKRNYFVYQVQKNINPYIIFPKLIDHAFWIWNKGK